MRPVGASLFEDDRHHHQVVPAATSWGCWFQPGNLIPWVLPGPFFLGGGVGGVFHPRNHGAPAPPEHCPCLQAKDAGQRTTIYKRDPSKQYGLKMKTSRAFFSEVERRFDTMPFTLR